MPSWSTSGVTHHQDRAVLYFLKHVACCDSFDDLFDQHAKVDLGHRVDALCVAVGMQLHQLVLLRVPAHLGATELIDLAVVQNVVQSFQQCLAAGGDARDEARLVRIHCCVNQELCGAKDAVKRTSEL